MIYKQINKQFEHFDRIQFGTSCFELLLLLFVGFVLVSIQFRTILESMYTQSVSREYKIIYATNNKRQHDGIIEFVCWSYGFLYSLNALTKRLNVPIIKFWKSDVWKWLRVDMLNGICIKLILNIYFESFPHMSVQKQKERGREKFRSQKCKRN